MGQSPSGGQSRKKSSSGQIFFLRPVAKVSCIKIKELPIGTFAQIESMDHCDAAVFKKGSVTSPSTVIMARMAKAYIAEVFQNPSQSQRETSLPSIFSSHLPNSKFSLEIRFNLVFLLFPPRFLKSYPQSFPWSPFHIWDRHLSFLFLGAFRCLRRLTFHRLQIQSFPPNP